MFVTNLLCFPICWLLINLFVVFSVVWFTGFIVCAAYYSFFPVAPLVEYETCMENGLNLSWEMESVFFVSVYWVITIKILLGSLWSSYRVEILWDTVINTPATNPSSITSLSFLQEMCFTSERIIIHSGFMSIALYLNQNMVLVNITFTIFSNNSLITFTFTDIIVLSLSLLRFHLPGICEVKDTKWMVMCTGG